MNRRVLHVIPFLWSGAGNVVTRLCLSQQQSHEVSIVTSGTSRGLRDWPVYRRRLAAAGIAHNKIDFFDRDAATFWSGVDELARLISSWRPDVVHTHAGVPACAAAIVRDAGVHPFRLVNHVYSWGEDRPVWMNSMDLWGIGRSDRIVCSARAYEGLLRRHGIPASRVACIPWGLDVESIRREAGPHARTSTSGPVIGYVGRIEPRKCQLELVNAFARFVRVIPGAKLELVGPTADTEYAARVVKAVRRHGLERAVALTGRVRNVYRRVARWDVFVSLASDEGQGLAVLEAMALGVPVLARRVAGIEDYLDDGVNGWVCRGTSARAVEQAIGRVLNDPNRMRIAARARAMVERRYRWDQTVKAIEKLYRP